MKVLIPRPGCWFAEMTGLPLAGPFHDSGEPWQSVNYSTADLATFVQGNKIASENSVFHQKVNGNIYVVPQLSKMTKRPSKDSFGHDVYEVKGYTRSVAGKSPKTMLTPIDFAITNQASGFYKYLHKASHVARVGPFQVNICQISSSTLTNGRPNGWVGDVKGYKITHIDPTSFWYTETRSPDFRIPGPHNEADGRALARERANEDFLVTSTKRTVRRKFFLDDVGFSMSSVKSWVNSLVNPRLFQDLPSLNNHSWGDLIHEATNNLDANSANMIAFFRDLKDVKSLIPKLKELGKMSTHANNYLAMEYGVLPTVSDLKAIWNAFSSKKFYDRLGYRRVSAYEIIRDSSTLLTQPVQVTHTRRIHVAVNDRDTGLDALSERLRSMGFFPSLTNIWDLVPYSFVLDWFVDVGSVFERIDTRHRLINLDIPYVIKSDKIEVNLNSIDPNSGVGLDLVVSRYSRDVTTDVPQPRIFGEISKPPTVQNHWIEGSALIIQRTKK